MEPYWLFLKTVANTLITLMGAALALFTSAPGPDIHAPRATTVVRASFDHWTVAPAPDPVQEPADATKTMVIDALVRALKDTDAGVRRHAARALAEMGDSRAVAGLVDALADKDREVRRAAVSALGEIGDSSALEPLIRAMKDEDPEVRRRAIAAIAELGEGDGRSRGTAIPRPRPNPNPNPNPRPGGAS